MKMLDDLPAEIISLIVQALDPFNALRLSYVSRRLFYAIRGLVSYWDNYGFNEVGVFIATIRQIDFKRHEKTKALLKHLISSSGSNVDVEPLRSALSLLEKQTILGIFEMKQVLLQLDPYYAPVIFQHVHKVAEQSILFCASVGALNIVREGLQLLNMLGISSGESVWRETLVSSLHQTISDAAEAGECGIAKEGIMILENIVNEFDRRLFYAYGIEPTCRGLTQAARMGAWSQFERSLTFLEEIGNYGNHPVDYKRWTPYIERSISRSSALGGSDSVEMGRRILALLDMKTLLCDKIRSDVC